MRKIYTQPRQNRRFIALLKTHKLPNYAINYSAWSTSPFSICSLLMEFSIQFALLWVHYKQLMLHYSYCGLLLVQISNMKKRFSSVHIHVQCMLRPSRYTWDIQQQLLYMRHLGHDRDWRISRGLDEGIIKMEIAICLGLSSVSSLPRSHSVEPCWRNPWWGSSLLSSLWGKMRWHKALIQHLKNVGFLWG